MRETIAELRERPERGLRGARTTGRTRPRCRTTPASASSGTSSTPRASTCPRPGSSPASAARPAAAARSWRCSTPAWPTRAAGRFRRAPDLRRSTFVQGLRLRRPRPAPERRVRPRHPRGRHDRPARTTASAWPGSPTTRRSCRCGCSTARARRLGGDLARDPLRGQARRRRDQPQPRVPRRGARAEIPTCSARSASPASRAWWWWRRPATRRTPRSPTPRARRSVIAVGATTANGCQADYSNAGRELDLVAPGGGNDAANADNPWDAEHCRPDDDRPRHLPADLHARACARFGLPGGYEGTSMAARTCPPSPRLLIATKRLGADPDPAARRGAPRGRPPRDLGPAGLRRPLRPRARGRRGALLLSGNAAPARAAGC